MFTNADALGDKGYINMIELTYYMLRLLAYEQALWGALVAGRNPPGELVRRQSISVPVTPLNSALNPSNAPNSSEWNVTYRNWLKDVPIEGNVFPQ